MSIAPAPAPTIAWSALFDALVQIESLDPTDSGVLSFGAPPTGGVFIDRGRICWVAAHGLQRRLRDLLRAYAAIPDADLDRVYERCRAEGRLLGETLLAEGWIDQRDLRAVLRRHSAESLVKLFADPQPTRWSTRGMSYQPHVSFDAVDMLLEAVSLVVPRADEALAELNALDLEGLRGAAFAMDGARDAVLPIAVFGDGLTVHALRTLGRWAQSIPAATRELGTSPAFALASTAAGDTVAVWWRRQILYTVLCDDRGLRPLVAAHHLTLR